MQYRAADYQIKTPIPKKQFINLCHNKISMTGSCANLGNQLLNLRNRQMVTPISTAASLLFPIQINPRRNT
jgi:hypothetical protein